MRYDFETIIDRHDRDALAIDELGNGFAPDKPKDGFDVIPMWIADMNFETVPTVSEAIRNRISHGAFVILIHLQYRQCHLKQFRMQTIQQEKSRTNPFLKFHQLSIFHLQLLVPNYYRSTNIVLLTAGDRNT